MYSRYLVLALFVLIIFLIHRGADRRFVKRLDFSKKCKLLLRAFIYVNFLSVLGYIYFRYISWSSRLLYFVLSLSVGIVLLLLLVMILYEIFFRLQKHISFLRKYKRFVDILFIVFIFAYIGIGIYSITPKVHVVELNEGVLPKVYKIAQISDLHIGRLVDRDFVADVVKKVNEQNPDIVVITGDLIDGRPKYFKDVLAELTKLKSKYGTFYITGNHEYFYGVKEIMDYVKSLGITVLQNSAVRLKDFYVVGVLDNRRRGQKEYGTDFKKAFRGIPKGAVTLLLAHQPKIIEKLNGIKPSLILCGHTHAGQIWPFGYFVRLFQPYLKGLHKLSDKSYIYISSGTGFWGPPMRVGSQGEITILKWR